jgi:hypothetical protein
MQHRAQRAIGRTESVSTSNLMTSKKKKNPVSAKLLA